MYNFWCIQKYPSKCITFRNGVAKPLYLLQFLVYFMSKMIINERHQVNNEDMIVYAEYWK